MRTRDLEDIAVDMGDILDRLPVGTRVRMERNPNPGTVVGRPFICDAGTVSVLVRWDNGHPDRNTHYIRNRDLVVV